MNNIHGDAIHSSYWEHYGEQGGLHYYRFNQDRAPIARELQVDFTVRKTGPIVVRQIVCSAEDTTTLLPHPNIKIIVATLRQVDEDHTNDSAWVNLIIAQGEPSAMINKAVLAVRRDIENLGELRLSDTIRQLCHSLNVNIVDNESYQTVLKAFFKALQSNLAGMNLSNLSLIQADYFLPNLSVFCFEHEIPYDIKKSGFFPSFAQPNEPTPSMKLAVLNCNNDNAAACIKLYEDIQQHLKNIVTPSLSLKNKQQVTAYLRMIEVITDNLPLSLPNNIKASLNETIAGVRTTMVNIEKQNYNQTAELFGKGNDRPKPPHDSDQNHCCVISLYRRICG